MAGREECALRPYDVLIKGTQRWTIVGVHMGCADQENLIALQSLDKHSGYVPGIGTILTMYVPERLINMSDVFRRVSDLSENTD